MIRIFPDFSVQVTAAAAGGAAGGVSAGPGMGRASTAANGNPQNVQGITSYQQRFDSTVKGQLFENKMHFLFVNFLDDYL
ncbi:UNVERIFIED_CONTAM: hypothetical protein K2H54_042425 [Gekko kuhli]